MEYFLSYRWIIIVFFISITSHASCQSILDSDVYNAELWLHEAKKMLLMSPKMGQKKMTTSSLYLVDDERNQEIFEMKLNRLNDEFTHWKRVLQEVVSELETALNIIHSTPRYERNSERYQSATSSIKQITNSAYKDNILYNLDFVIEEFISSGIPVTPIDPDNISPSFFLPENGTQNFSE